MTLSSPRLTTTLPEEPRYDGEGPPAEADEPSRDPPGPSYFVNVKNA
jgi:hypothetical protein